MIEQKKLIDEDKNNVTKKIVYQKLNTIQLDMLSFDIDKEKIKDLIGLFAAKYKLSIEDTNDLFVRKIEL